MWSSGRPPSLPPFLPLFLLSQLWIENERKSATAGEIESGRVRRERERVVGSERIIYNSVSDSRPKKPGRGARCPVRTSPLDFPTVSGDKMCGRSVNLMSYIGCSLKIFMNDDDAIYFFILENIL